MVSELEEVLSLEECSCDLRAEDEVERAQRPAAGSHPFFDSGASFGINYHRSPKYKVTTPESGVRKRGIALYNPPLRQPRRMRHQLKTAHSSSSWRTWHVAPWAALWGILGSGAAVTRTRCGQGRNWRCTVVCSTESYQRAVATQGAKHCGKPSKDGYN